MHGRISMGWESDDKIILGSAKEGEYSDRVIQRLLELAANLARELNTKQYKST